MSSCVAVDQHPKGSWNTRLRVVLQTLKEGRKDLRICFYPVVERLPIRHTRKCLFVCAWESLVDDLGYQQKPATIKTHRASFVANNHQTRVRISVISDARALIYTGLNNPTVCSDCSNLCRYIWVYSLLTHLLKLVHISAKYERLRCAEVSDMDSQYTFNRPGIQSMTHRSEEAQRLGHGYGVMVTV
jgi:hypothetical protein